MLKLILSMLKFWSVLLKIGGFAKVSGFYANAGWMFAKDHGQRAKDGVDYVEV
ncbi:hypothetical protein [Salinibacillus xinjiangensis]|uniref:hypothetical protein n=1 Tax=Salinibacillus xinjiangensis TaxID=1229268 RepID=UPI00129A61C0|nr:hypothetical protein [Salinibacillus xinjiangensis]